MLIDSSYFTAGPRHILNATSGVRGTFPDASAIQVNGAINAYVAELQNRYLTRLFGTEHSGLLDAYIKGRETEEPVERNEGYEEILTRIREAFAYYVFFHILRDANTQSTVTGLVMLKCANEYVAPIRRQVTAWNTMADLHRELALWCHEGKSAIKGLRVSEVMTTKINTFNL